MLPLLVVLVWTLIMVGNVTASWARPNQSLRIASTSCLIAWFLTALVENLFPHWHGLHVGVMLIDAAYACLLGWIALQTSAIWATFATGFQVSCVAVHFAFILSPLVNARAYYTALVVVSFLMALSILAGALKGIGQGERHTPV